MPTRFSIILGITSVLLALAVDSKPVLAQSAAARQVGQVVEVVQAGQVLAPGTHNRTLLRGKEPPVHFALSIPAKYSPSKPVPLILALHFGVGGADGAGAGRSVLSILVRPALEELGAIIVAPDSLGGNWSTPENERAVKQLLDDVLGSYSIDKKKIVVTGYSMGGAGAWSIAEKYPEYFSAVIPVSGRPPA